MKIAVLGATGKTGRLLVARGLERGHDVIALARRPEQFTSDTSGRLSVVRADVTAPGGITTAVEGADVVVSGLGITKEQNPLILVNGARQLVEAGSRVIWLTSLGMGETEGALGRITGTLLKGALGYQWEAKGLADRVVRNAGGTTVHAGPLTDKPYQNNGHLLRATAFKPRMIPPTAPRAGIAALMVAEAETPQFADIATIALFGKK